jgi:hypothetical protein
MRLAGFVLVVAHPIICIITTVVGRGDLYPADDVHNQDLMSTGARTLCASGVRCTYLSGNGGSV